MPTPGAQAVADWLYHRGERTAIAYEDRGDIAEALDRFAAQRGAEQKAAMRRKIVCSRVKSR